MVTLGIPEARRCALNEKIFHLTVSIMYPNTLRYTHQAEERAVSLLY